MTKKKFEDLVKAHLMGVAAIGKLAVSADNAKQAKILASVYDNAQLSREHAAEVTSDLRDQVSRFKDVGGYDKLKQHVEQVIQTIEKNVRVTTGNGHDKTQTTGAGAQMQQQNPQHQGGQQK